MDIKEWGHELALNDRPTVMVMGELRMDIGLTGRVLYGGIVEEVLVQWGLLSLLAWAGVQLVGAPTPTVIWTATILAGFVFGLGHRPFYLGVGCRFTRLFLGFTISLNLGASLLFSWLFWQFGLVAAMASHALFHLSRWLLDRQYVKNHSTEPIEGTHRT